jgi:hypothetical protein
MGKRNKTNELHEYLESIKEAQDHQYSKGYWFGKVRRTYHSPTRARFTAWYYILFGGSIIFMMVGIVIVGLLRGKDFFEIVPEDTSFFAIFFFGIGLLAFWAGVKGLQSGKKGKE